MTTIAASAKTGEVAADSLVTAGDTVIGTTRKVYRIGNTIVACMGKLSDVQPFLTWLRTNGKTQAPKLSDEFGALVLTKDGIAAYNDSCEAMIPETDSAAMGAGWEVARGAMAHGATPKEAVEIACKLNVYTGPPVVVEKL